MAPIMPFPSATVIVCAYTFDRWDQLVRCIDALQAQTVLPQEILIVIDHNQPLYNELCQWLESLGELPTSVRIITNTQQRGLSGARNSGIQLTETDILAFIDEDAVAEPTWLELLLSAYIDPTVIGVGGAILPDWADGEPAWFPSEFNWVVGCTYRGMPTELAPVRNLIGCNMSFRRELFTEVGGFRHDMGRLGTIPVGCEETEWCIRVRQARPSLDKILFHPQARVHHHVPQSRAKFQYFSERCYAEGISKAMVAGYVGQEDALSNERAYTMKILPSGMAHALLHAVKTADVRHTLRFFAIPFGLLATTMGYVRGQLTRRTKTQYRDRITLNKANAS